jgi:dephospho-CoA kinase
MISHPIKIGIAGTHSTGKSTFLTLLAELLETRGLKIGRISDLARSARALGFPILTEHTFESTLWIMAECMRQEAEASLACDVILVDRPVLDALGYLEAALEVTDRQMIPRRLEELKIIARAHSADYDLLVVTTLDRTVRLGEGRDQDQRFREAAARHIEALAADITPNALQMTSMNTADVISAASAFVFARLPPGRVCQQPSSGENL